MRMNVQDERIGSLGRARRSERTALKSALRATSRRLDDVEGGDLHLSSADPRASNHAYTSAKQPPPPQHHFLQAFEDRIFPAQRIAKKLQKQNHRIGRTRRAGHHPPFPSFLSSPSALPPFFSLFFPFLRLLLSLRTLRSACRLFAVFLCVSVCLSSQSVTWRTSDSPRSLCFAVA